MLSDHARYLREKAKQFRDIAGRYQTRLSPQLLNLADEFDAKAAEIEAATDDNVPPSCP
jgi:hypothetical protein